MDENGLLPKNVYAATKHISEINEIVIAMKIGQNKY